MSCWRGAGPSLPKRTILGVAAVFLGGCGQVVSIPHADQRCTVHGEVRLNDEPLRAGTISFESYGEGVKGMTVTGLIIDGSFKIDARNGPVMGPNRFDISVEGATGSVVGTSGMIEIQQGSKDSLDFDLTTKSKK
ncbi:hypothetical protein Spb1_17830 [Planctopirus ephydatiae]|jgi:hypothetical protein|uniref:Lipoprotein n=1 Tax=Planctopirus ephydatiae TaxID=2528019 RepID=A0A518GMT7_9PLAN|nr:hypothetical protein [Planctopirus ephydatiae]QDV29864.1 hypothetical protein Spb1_17830 [Planctopirus ephydatiae]